MVIYSLRSLAFTFNQDSVSFPFWNRITWCDLWKGNKRTSLLFILNFFEFSSEINLIGDASHNEGFSYKNEWKFEAGIIVNYIYLFKFCVIAVYELVTFNLILKFKIRNFLKKLIHYHSNTHKTVIIRAALRVNTPLKICFNSNNANSRILERWYFNQFFFQYIFDYNSFILLLSPIFLLIKLISVLYFKIQNIPTEWDNVVLLNHTA